MHILPAVDIRGGLCVNLVQGDYAQETVFSRDPVAQAKLWWKGLGGDGLVHIVDLDGAKAGHCCIQGELCAMAAAGIRYEVGGGIRSMETLESIFECGAARAILGTAAHESPDLLEEACSAWPGKIAVGIDAREGWVSLHGWLEDTATDAVDFARLVQQAGAARIIYTDIKSDGMMQGPNYEATRAVAEGIDIPVTISGGISSLDDIRHALPYQAHGIDEIIVGRALYLKIFSVEEAVAAARNAA